MIVLPCPMKMIVSLYPHELLVAPLSKYFGALPKMTPARMNDPRLNLPRKISKSGW